MAVNIHITIIELNALHTKRQYLFQELDAVIHLLMEAKHWGLRKSRNSTSLIFLFKSRHPPKATLFPYTTLFRSGFRTVTDRKGRGPADARRRLPPSAARWPRPDRKSTRLNSSHVEISYAVFCLKKKKHWGLRKSRNATSLNSRFKSLDTLKVKIISVTFRRVIRTNHKKASKIWRHENIQLGGCQS